MYSLGIDTSNYATSLAVFDLTTREVVSAKKRFLPVKTGELGLRQSDALFHHTSVLPEILSELAGEADLSKVSVVGVSEKPRPVEGSYMPCFLAGVNAATAFSLAAGVPLIKTTHQQGHFAAAIYAAGGEQLFNSELLLFHVSGGTTDLIHYTSINKTEEIGTSKDLYAGQAVDRLGKALGFPFPSGTFISEAARGCEDFIKPKVSVDGLSCSLSGLENQCQKLINEGRDKAYVSKYCLLCIGETIVRMARNALSLYPGLPVVCAGGVMSSTLIAEYVSKRLPEVYFVPSLYSSDNAIGVSIIASFGAK